MKEGHETMRTTLSIFLLVCFSSIFNQKIFTTEIFLMSVFVFLVTLKGVTAHKLFEKESHCKGVISLRGQSSHFMHPWLYGTYFAFFLTALLRWRPTRHGCYEQLTAMMIIAELAKLICVSEECKCQGHFDIVVGSQVHCSIMKSCGVFTLSFFFSVQLCIGFGYNGVNFLHSSLYGAVFWICDGNSVDDTVKVWVLLSVEILLFHTLSAQWAGWGDTAEAADPTSPKGYSIP